MSSVHTVEPLGDGRHLRLRGHFNYGGLGVLHGCKAIMRGREGDAPGSQKQKLKISSTATQKAVKSAPPLPKI